MKVDRSLIRGKNIFLPPEFKETEGEEVIIFKNGKDYFVFTCEEWKKLFIGINVECKGWKRRALKRSFSKRARKVKIKKGDIILIPAHLRRN